MTATMMFDTLFKRSSTGADQEWTVHTEDNVIITRWGQVGGSIQETRDIIAAGKNAGKKNETTPIQQAQLEAEALWTKKLKKGYVKSLTDARAGKVDDVIEGGVNPMLAHKYSEQAKKIVFPALVQPKFDGHRCIAVVENGKATLWTRTRKPITGLPHIIQAIEKLCAERGVAQDCRLVLDGELYDHDYRDRFEELSSFIRTPDPKPGHEVVQYHIYDIADEALYQTLRTNELRALFQGQGQVGPLVCVETRQVANKEELDEAFGEFMEAGYEGLMVRNLAGKYVGKRSFDLQKVKEFDDAEFLVIGVEEGRGKLAGKAIFVCRYTDRPTSIESLNDPIFRCKMKGKLEDLAQYVQNPGLAIGKMLTVRYFGISNTGGVPRFPVGIRFREEDVEQVEE